MTPAKGQERYHVRKHGESAERREKELTKPLENGGPVDDPFVRGSAKYLRKHVHHVNRRFIRKWLGNAIVDFIEDAFDDPRGDYVCAVLDNGEDSLRNQRLNSWMYRKVSGKRCTVTVTASRIIFNH